MLILYFFFSVWYNGTVTYKSIYRENFIGFIVDIQLSTKVFGVIVSILFISHLNFNNGLFVSILSLGII